MTALTPAPASRGAGANLGTGLTPATAADTFPAGPNTYLRVKNAGAGTVTVTVTPTTGSGPQGTTISALALVPVVEATTGDRIYGPFPQNPFGDASGNVNVSYSTVTSVTVGAFVLPGA
jgi:hypothetical protein